LNNCSKWAFQEVPARKRKGMVNGVPKRKTTKESQKKTPPAVRNSNDLLKWAFRKVSCKEKKGERLIVFLKRKT
jgi:hypothetical protein